MFFLGTEKIQGLGFLGLVRHNNILFVFFTAGFQETLQKIGERDRYPAFFFREQLQRRNVTQDVKHHEDCEQLFMSVGKCFTIEALVKFVNVMAIKDGNPANNRPPLFHIFMMGNNKQVSFNSVLNKFIDEFLLLPSTSFPGPTHEEEDQENEVESLSASENSQLCKKNTDFINNYYAEM